jgi:hypothetical protein
MRFFTPDLYARLQDPAPAAMDAADADWERAEQAYQDHLRRWGGALAPVLTRFDGVLLHDAEVLNINRCADQFVMVLRKDIPPRDVVTLTYTLAGEPIVDREAFPAAYRSGVMRFEYDEFDVDEQGGPATFTHSILFSNGWEVRVRFRDIQVSLAEPIYPPGVPAPLGPTAAPTSA